VPDESAGFESEPVYDAGPDAALDLAQQRLYAAQNAVVRLEGERRGKVLVDPEDLRTALTYAAHFDVADDPSIMRLTAIAEMATDGALGGSGAANSPRPVSQEPGNVSVALSDAADTGGAA
jgi:hypothetical protein